MRIQLDQLPRRVVAGVTAEGVLVELLSPGVPLTGLVRSIIRSRRRRVEFGGGAPSAVGVVEQPQRRGVVAEVFVVVLRPGEVPLGALL